MSQVMLSWTYVQKEKQRDGVVLLSLLLLLLLLLSLSLSLLLSLLLVLFVVVARNQQLNQHCAGGSY